MDPRPLLDGEPSPLLAAHLSHLLAAARPSSLADGASFLAASLLAAGGCFVGENERAVARSGGKRYMDKGYTCLFAGFRLFFKLFYLGCC